MGMSWLILFEIIRLPKLSKVQMKRHNALLLLCTILDPLPTLSWRDKTAVVVIRVDAFMKMITMC